MPLQGYVFRDTLWPNNYCSEPVLTSATFIVPHTHTLNTGMMLIATVMYEQSMTHIFLKKGRRKYVTPSHLLHRMCFSQYQAIYISSTVPVSSWGD